MKKKIFKKPSLSIVLILLLTQAANAALPEGFVYLDAIAPTIQFDIRYAGYHNFVGRPIKGYHSARCILTSSAAKALAKVQNELLRSGLSLKVYDCYRPIDAVQDFINWSQNPRQTTMKAEFYPQVSKTDLFRLGYIAERSGHSRGSTVDLTLTPIHSSHMAYLKKPRYLVSCFAPYHERFQDGSIDMGTGYDCMDARSHVLTHKISHTARHNRMKLRRMMIKYGFKPYAKEWWHFTFRNEPYPHSYFNFYVR